MAAKLTLSLRSPAFQKRLREACENSADCPPLHKGRLVWLRDRLEERGTVVTIESVRRWLAGEGRPRQDKCEDLAKVLGVDGTWLYMGKETSPPYQSQATPVIHETDDIPVLPIKLRPGLIVTVSGLPLDLSSAEARKIANIILAHTSPTSDGSAG